MEKPITAHPAGKVTALAAEVGATAYANRTVLCDITRDRDGDSGWSERREQAA